MQQVLQKACDIRSVTIAATKAAAMAAVFLFFAGAITSTAVAAPVALIIDITGATGDEFAPFMEIEAGGRIELSAHGRLEFLDYNSCKTVVIKGGKISFTERRFLLSGGKIMNQTRGRCPKVVTLNKDARVGGVLVRSSPATLRVSGRPQFVFIGPNSAAAVQVRITSEGAPTLALPLADRQLQWPAGDDALAAGNYELEVLSKDGATSKRVPFEVSTKSRAGKITIIRMN